MRISLKFETAHLSRVSRKIEFSQMMMRSKSYYFPKGTIIADSRDEATGMMVITQGSVTVELPVDSEDADAAAHGANSLVLYTIGRG